jgi:phage terminase small subunit
MATLKNPKHEAVLRAFIASAERVGWKAYASVYANSSQRAAETAWSRLLKDAEFSARLAELDKAVETAAIAKGVMSREEVLLEPSHLGRSNVANCAHILVSSDVVDDVKQLPPEHSAAIAELTVESFEECDPDGDDGETRTVKRVKFKLHDKRGALRDLGQHYKLFTEKHELGGEGGGPIRTRDESEPLSDLDAARRIAFLLAKATRAALPAPAKSKRRA